MVETSSTVCNIQVPKKVSTAKDREIRKHRQFLLIFCALHFKKSMVTPQRLTLDNGLMVWLKRGRNGKEQQEWGWRAMVPMRILL